MTIATNELPTPTIKPDGAITLHRNGDVSYWDVYLQGWERRPAGLIRDHVLASFCEEERCRVLNHAGATA